MMRDLHQLVEEHNIKSRLYSGVGLERIYQMMGDSRVTRWLSTACEVEYNNEQTWHHLIEFLERDLQVQQQDLLIQSRLGNKRQKQEREEKEHVGRYNSSFTGNSCIGTSVAFVKKLRNILQQMDQRNKNCALLCLSEICRKTETRLQELKNKGYCFQCLFPGASQDKGKHYDGICRRIFMCKDKSQGRCPIKKHVSLYLLNHFQEVLIRWPFACVNLFNQ